MLAPGTHRQTISYLTRRFREVGIEPDSRHGQNFLIDLNLVRLLVDRADLRPDDVVLEVGTGTGSLTVLIAERARAVVTVEVDPRMFQLASEELVDYPNVTMLHLDALHNKNRLDERLMAAVDEQRSKHVGGQLKMVANLPYNIATPVISNLLAGPLIPRTMTVTVQKELADRMMARPSTKDYGALSIWVQSQCHVELVREMPPTVFWPRPKVTSAIVHLAFDASLRHRIADADGFHRFVRSLFLHRRKLLRSVLATVLKGQLRKFQIDEILAQVELGAQTRAEELDVPKVIELFGAVRAATSAST
jgi:16S rRNA (adenine1518-N6/adenine1519-N6)-dimethyltransferase